MKLLVFSVYDAKAAAFMTPFHMPTRGQALRAFGDVVADGKHDFSKHPEDFSLYVVGEFDQSTGKLDGHLPEPLSPALAFVEPVASPPVVKSRPSLVEA